MWHESIRNSPEKPGRFSFETLGIPDGEADLKDDTKPVDLSLVLGVDVGFKLGEQRRLLIGGNYTLGMLDWSETVGVELRNGAIGLTVGLSSPRGSPP